jgi:L-alanine-DL-glutamate epimerase-like enolase superfamily enzyme
MRIEAVEILPVVVPDALPGWLDEAYLVVAVVRVEGGLEGVGVAGSSRPLFFRTLVAGVQELADQVIGLPINEPERLHARLVPPNSFFGPGGVLPMAACAIDTAVWDLIAKAANQPLWRLLGGMSDRIRGYDSSSLVPDASLEDLRGAAKRSLAAGYRAMKMRLGPDLSASPEDVFTRVSAVREVIGPDIELMLDLNQAWSPVRTLRVLRRLEELELAWVEDPIDMGDVAGQAALTAATSVPICAGEYQSGVRPLLDLLQARAVDILMVDLMHVGGITPFRRVAAAAELFGVPVVSHLFPEVFAHLLAAVPGGYMVEDMPWSSRVFHQRPALIDGELRLGNAPGLGLDLDRSFIARHRAW